MFEMWAEKYRPKTIDEIAGQEEFKRGVTKFITKGGIPNLLLYGAPGTGKTTAAFCIAYSLLGNDLDGNFSEINASDDRGVEKMRVLVNNATRHMPIGGKIRIILLDESDGLLRDAQELLRRPLEKATKTRFILTANEIKNFIAPLTQRLFCYEFKPLPEEVIVKRLKEIAKKENVEISDSELREIAKNADGSLRVAINELQKFAISGESKFEEIISKYK